MAPSKKDRFVRSNHLVSLLPALRALCSLLDRSRTKGMIIGGVAASLLGRPRMTADIDATVILEDASMDRFFDLALAHGLTPRISNPAAFARRSAMLLLKHDSSGIPVDVAQSRLPFERAATIRATHLDVEGFSVPLPTPEDLIIMKAIAHRSQDLEDIRGIALSQPRLNVALIRKEVMEFARALDMPDLWTDIAGLFKQKSSVKKSRRQRR
ncbi:MAG: DUF6036 family nucleotidyltransferase [Nitrospiraceae bacterium]